MAPLPNTADLASKVKIPNCFSPDSINDRIISPRSDTNIDDLPIMIRNEAEQQPSSQSE